MDIRNLIESEDPPRPSSSPVSRRQTVSSLLNSDDEEPTPKHDSKSSSSPVREVEVTPVEGFKSDYSVSVKSDHSQDSEETEPDHRDARSRQNSYQKAQSGRSEQSDQSETSPQAPKAGKQGKPAKSAKSGSRKPKRYTTPPIWAQNWVSNGTAKPSDRSDRFDGISGPARGTRQAQSLQGLTTLTSVVPYEDLTRKLTEWLYSNLFQLNDNDRKNIEVELKVGQIFEKATERRLQMPIVTETIIRSDYARADTFFKSQLNDQQFTQANFFLDELSAPSGEAVPLLRKTMSKTRDSIYSNGKSADKVRVTFHENTNQTERIIKRRVADLMVFSPGDLLDIRVSINVELPTQPSSAESRPPSTVRHKNRQSYLSAGMQIDLTSVVTDNATKSVKEMELELDAQMLLKHYTSFSDNSDPDAMDKFEEVVRLGMDNARILCRKLSR